MKKHFLRKLVLSLPLIILFSAFTVACTGTPAHGGESSAEPSETPSDEASKAPVYGTVADEIKQAYASYDLTASANSKGSIASAEEQAAARDYFTGLFSSPESLPISFEYDGVTYNGFGSDFEVCLSDGVITAKHTSGLTVTVSYGYNYEYAAFEWALYFRNDGSSNSGVLRNVYVADIDFVGESPLLEYMRGESYQDANGYAAMRKELTAGTEFMLEPGYSGKSTYDNSPYHRLFFGDEGVSVALGWQGRWKMCYSVSESEGKTVTNLRAGQYSFASYLKPGEEIRTPRITLVKYSGRNRNHAVNMWRRWFYDCAYYRDNDEIIKPVLILADGELLNVILKEKTLIQKVAALESNDVDTTGYLTNIWLDAGWYYLRGTTRIWKWEQTGTWRMDTNRYPSGLKDVSDAMKAKGGFTNLWFEPERVYMNTELFTNKEWTIASPNSTDTKLLNFGIPAVQDWWLETVVSIMDKGGMSMYRQDCNFFYYDWLLAGDKAQGNNRTGITEALHINGITEFYAKLLEARPGMPIDMCASGGCRNDMDALRISEMFTLSDCSRIYSTQMQNRRLEMYAWSTFTCGSNPGNSDYNLLSNMSYNMTLISDRDRAVWTQIKHLFLCDYFPLTEWTSSENAWCGYEFYDTEFREGFVQFVRRSASDEEERTFKLYDLDTAKNYEIINLFTDEKAVVSGKALTETGITVSLGKEDGVIYKIVEVAE